MSFDWYEYLRLAKELVTKSSEAKLRSAISRAYYAVFCKARNYLRDIEQKPIPPKSIAHRLVIETLKAHPNDKLKSVGVNLDRLRSIRNEADYNDIFIYTLGDIEYCLSLAEDAFETILEVEAERC